jgi:hypothetical protein
MPVVSTPFLREVIMTLNAMATLEPVKPPFPAGSAEERAEVASLVGFYLFDMNCRRIEELLRRSLVWEC